MIEKLLTFDGPRVALVLGFGLTLLASCSKEKEETVAEPAQPKVEEAAAPAVALQEPDAPVSEPAKAPAKAELAAAAGAVTFVGRYESTAKLVSRSLWQTVNTTAAPQQYALITPRAGSGDWSKLLTAGGPENVALGLGDGSLRTADGQGLMVGQDYQFTFSSGEAEGLWKVEIKAAP